MGYLLVRRIYVPVRISAALDQTTMTDLLAGLMPLTVNLGEEGRADRAMRIELPDRVEFVSGQGIRIHTGAQLKWTVGGANLSFTISSVTILLRPLIVASRINFPIVIEEADLKNVPSILDRSVVAKVNERLAAKPDAVGWSFGETLALRLEMPKSMAPVAAFEMEAANAAVDVDATQMTLKMDLPMSFVHA